MSTGPLSLGLDLGTGSVKALLLDRQGQELSVASAPLQVGRPRLDWAEASPDGWWEATENAVSQLPPTLRANVACLGLSGQMHGVVLAHRDARWVRPAILWLDRRAEGAQVAYQAMAPGLKHALGNPFTPGMAGPMLWWLAANQRGPLDEADFALQPKDWLRLRLTGQAGSEPSDASGTLLYDLPAAWWSSSACQAFGIPERLLPPLGNSAGDRAGTLGDGAAASLGLAPGLPVAFGAADTAAALVGTGLVSPGPVQLTVGTGAQVVVVRSSPQPDQALRYHLFSAAQPRSWYALAAVQAAGAAFTWAFANLACTWPEAYSLLERSPVGSHGVVFVPHVAGARSPSMDSTATAGFYNLRLSNDRADLVRSVFEGVAFSIAEAADCLPELDGAPAVRLAGGGSTQPEWRQILSDVLAKPLEVLESPNASPRGAALLGLEAAGLPVPPTELAVSSQVEPRAAQAQAWADAYGRWLALKPTAAQAENDRRKD